MKIGVDAVLVGAWADVTGAKTILDVGTGCGVIAMMCAQRNLSAIIHAIDIDRESVLEAEENFNRCRWSGRLQARREDFNDMKLHDIDVIVSNPPYFESGVLHPHSPRLVARHKDNLSPEILLAKGREYLSANGRIAMIVPSEQLERLVSVGRSLGLVAIRASWVRGHLSAPIKRLLIEFATHGNEIDTINMPVLTLEESPGIPTAEHRMLCGDFYLKY